MIVRTYALTHSLMNSMTGIGRVRGKIGKKFVTVELRSLNHKFCEVSVRLPQKYLSFEFPIIKLVKDSVSRGKVEVALMEERGGAGDDFCPDLARLRDFHRFLKSIGKDLGLKEPVSLSHLLSQSSLWMGREEKNVEKDWPAVKKLLEKALKGLKVMRLREGKVIGRGLSGRQAELEKILEKIAVRREGVVPQLRERLSQRLAALQGEVAVDPERLASEVVYYVDRSDVSEEIDRLRSHFGQMKKIMTESGACGRSLDFLIQEMNREWNTLSSKTQDAEISHLVVTAKSCLERMREQVQNVE